MNCPKCGAAVEEGKAYCSNPGCGAVPAPAAETKKYVAVDKELNFAVKLDFALFARLAAAAIVLLAAAIIYFSKK